MLSESHDVAEVKKIILTDIHQVRLDAMNALCNCASRDKKEVLTKKRMKIICAYLATSNESDTDKSCEYIILKLIELAESLDDFDYVETFKLYLERLNTKSTGNIETMLRFMSNQAKDLKRSGELFTDQAITQLIGLVECGSHYSSTQKLNVVEIITAYLAHECTKSISEDNLKRLLKNSFESYDTSLINSALTSLLLSTDKTQSLPRGILEILLANFDLFSHDDEFTSHIVFF